MPGKVLDHIEYELLKITDTESDARDHIENDPDNTRLQQQTHSSLTEAVLYIKA